MVAILSRGRCIPLGNLRLSLDIAVYKTRDVHPTNSTIGNHASSENDRVFAIRIQDKGASTTASFDPFWVEARAPIQYPTSTVYWCIASKLKVPLNLYGMNKTFLWVDLPLFNQLLLWRYYNDQKAYRILAALPFKISAPSLPCSLVPTPWAMSLYFKFRAIYFWSLNEY